MLPLHTLRIILSVALTAVAALSVHADDLDRIIPRHSNTLAGYNDIDSVRTHIDIIGVTDPVDGLWQLAGNQAVVAIIPCTDPSVTATGISCRQIVIVSSPRKSMRPGTVLGYLIPSARAGYYDARLYTSALRSVLQNHRRFTMHLTDAGHLSMTPVNPSWRVNLRHTFHFLIRASVTRNPSEDTGMQGFIKIHPTTGIKPSEPVYL